MKSLFLLCALLCAICVAAAPAPYIVTNYVQVSVYTNRGYTGTYTTYSDSTTEYFSTIEPKATPVNDALSTFTDTTNPDVTQVNIVIPSDSVKTSTIDYEVYSYSSSTETSYLVPITFTPSATCTNQNWTFITNVPVSIPILVQPQITPITVTPSTTAYSDYYYSKVQRTTVQVAIINPTDVAADILEFASSLAEPYGLSYCYTPTSYCATRSASAICTPTFAYDSSSNSGHSTSYGDGLDGYCWSNECFIRNVIIIVVCVPIGWILLWLLIGLWENWMSFKGLMLGKHRKRGMPYSWCCISFLFLCWVGPTYKAKSAEEQEILKARWKEMKMGEKLRLWVRWGFRWKYPDCLGEEPERDKRAFRQRCL